MRTPASRRRVLVTGGAGFIGIHSVAALNREGFEVLVLDDLRHACGEPLPAGADLIEAELSGPQAAAAVAGFRPQLALHLAAQGGVSRSVRDPARDFVFVADVVDANLRALTSHATGAINIGTGRATSVNAIVKQLIQFATPSPLGEGRGAGLQPEYVPTRPGEVRDTYLDVRKAEKVLGWSPKTALEDGLRETYVSFAKRAQAPRRGEAATREPAAAEAGPGRGSPEGSG